MSVIGSNILAGASGSADAEFNIERSLRFNSADSASLSLASYSGSGTFSCWVKRCKLGSAQTIITNVAFAADDTLNSSTAVFRDPSAWMHIVVSSGGTYVNGISVGSGSAVTPSAIGSGCDLYLAEVHFIDGQALAATDFGEYDSDNVWQPIEYAGTYGTNGFYLDFSDNTSTTTIAEDSSGNGNDWTANNFSVASGVGNDSLIDSPMNYEADSGNNGGNYATLNPLDSASNQSSSNGNLEHRGTNTSYGIVRSTFGVASGKWYWEGTVVGVDATNGTAGVAHIGITTSSASLSNHIGSDAYGWMYNFDALKFNNGSSSSYGNTYLTGDIIGVALDMNAGTLTFYKNGTSQGQAFSGLSGTIFPSFSAGSSGSGWNINFGQRPFAYTPPTGFKSLCTQNLPDPTIADGSTVMDAVTYTGNGSTQAISGLGFSPDLVWIKNRAQADNHKLIDSVRGATNELESNTTDAEVINVDGLTAFNADGFSLGADVEYNTNTETYVGWSWDGGTSTVSNTDGTITSSVRANSSAGFSIVSWSGSGSNATIGHGLNAAPYFITAKCRNAAPTSWLSYHNSVGATKYIELNSTNAAATASTVWNDTDPTSSVFSVGTSSGINQSGRTYIAYCFAPVEGYSAMGTYTGNGSSTDGPFVFTGFRPRWILYKASSAAYGWAIHDTKRSEYNAFVASLYPDGSFAEYNGAGHEIDILSNGFKPRNSNTRFNASGVTYIYAAFAEHPFKTARAR